MRSKWVRRETASGRSGLRFAALKNGDSQAVDRRLIRLPIARWRRWCDFRIDRVTGGLPPPAHSPLTLPGATWPRSRGRGQRAMGGLQWALSRLVLVAVGLAPMLVYW